jgi:hypothetical protein
MHMLRSLIKLLTLGAFLLFRLLAAIHFKSKVTNLAPESNILCMMVHGDRLILSDRLGMISRILGGGLDGCNSQCDLTFSLLSCTLICYSMLGVTATYLLLFSLSLGIFGAHL